MKAKDRYKIMLLKYLGDVENEFPTRTKYAKILGIKIPTLYKHFKPADFSEIEYEAYEIRKKTMTRQRQDVLTAMVEAAKGYSHPAVHVSAYMGEVILTDIIKHYPPSPAAAKEFFDRVEGKVTEKTEVNLGENSIAFALAAIENFRKAD